MSRDVIVSQKQSISTVVVKCRLPTSQLICTSSCLELICGMLCGGHLC